MKNKSTPAAKVKKGTNQDLLDTNNKYQTIKENKQEENSDDYEDTGEDYSNFTSQQESLSLSNSKTGARKHQI